MRLLVESSYWCTVLDTVFWSNHSLSFFPFAYSFAIFISPRNLIESRRTPKHKQKIHMNACCITDHSDQASKQAKRQPNQLKSNNRHRHCITIITIIIWISYNSETKIKINTNYKQNIKWLEDTIPPQQHSRPREDCIKSNTRLRRSTMRELAWGSWPRMGLWWRARRSYPVVYWLLVRYVTVRYAMWCDVIWWHIMWCDAIWFDVYYFILCIIFHFIDHLISLS